MWSAFDLLAPGHQREAIQHQLRRLQPAQDGLRPLEQVAAAILKAYGVILAPA
jgi:hypothetical protein